MENLFKAKYFKKLESILEKLNSLNYIIITEENLLTSIHFINSKHIDIEKFKPI